MQHPRNPGAGLEGAFTVQGASQTAENLQIAQNMIGDLGRSNGYTGTFVVGIP